MINNRPHANNTWQCCQIDDLQAGDILLFRPSKQQYFVQKFIMLCQALLNNKHGHYDTVHAGICTGRNAAGQPMLAHITVVPNRPNHYVHEPLQSMLDREGGDRAFLVYRSSDIAFAERLSLHATNVKQFNWSIPSAARSIIPCPRLFSRAATNPLSTNTFCSQFVVEAMKKASPQNYSQLHDHSSPKALESFLSQHADFQKMCHLGKTPFAELEAAILKELARLSTQTSVAAQQKFQRANSMYNQCLRESREMRLSEADKAAYILNALLPIFKENTGGNRVTPTSYKTISSFARNIGIFKHSPVVFPETKQSDLAYRLV